MIDFSSYDGERVSFKRSKFANLFLTNCNFSDLDGTGMSLAGSVLYGSKFHNADLTSADGLQELIKTIFKVRKQINPDLFIAIFGICFFTIAYTICPFFKTFVAKVRL